MPNLTSENNKNIEENLQSLINTSNNNIFEDEKIANFVKLYPRVLNARNNLKNRLMKGQNRYSLNLQIPNIRKNEKNMHMQYMAFRKKLDKLTMKYYKNKNAGKTQNKSNKNRINKLEKVVSNYTTHLRSKSRKQHSLPIQTENKLQNPSSIK